MRQLQEYQEELSVLTEFIKFYEKRSPETQRMLRAESPYYPYLRKYFEDASDEWVKEEFETNKQYSETKIYKSMRGEFLRSKSEVIIANALYTKQIPYRYECLINLDECQYFPDFTIKHPQTGKIYYWEHFGMMDDKTYCEKCFNKLKVYGNNSILPGINLITTFETRQEPLDSGKVMWLIDEYFLKI